VQTQNKILSGMALIALAVPVSAAAGAGAPAAPNPVTPPQTSHAASVDHKAIARAARSHRKALKRVTRLARTRARLAHRRHYPHGYLRKVSRWSTKRLKRHARKLQRRVRHLRRTGGAPNVSIPPQLKAIAYCESKNNPRAVSSTGKYRGLFQFDYRTWATVGGKGDPADAHPLEQYRRAAMLYHRAGASPWPVCGR
jgi:hypothetical protein